MSRDRLTLITAAEANPVSLAEAKLHSRIDFTDDDDIVSAIISAATGDAEKFLGRALMPQTWDYYLDDFPDAGAPVKIPLPPLISITGVFYTDTAGAEQEFTSFSVDAASEPARIYVAPGVSWPTPRATPAAVRIRFVAGYPLTSASPLVPGVPAPIIAAIKLVCGTLYEHRETVVIGQAGNLMPWSAEQLLRKYRVELSLA